MENYVDLAIKTEAPTTDELKERLVKQVRMIHAVLGKLTEIGEFADQLKRHIFYGKELDYVNLSEEIGDGFWYDALAISDMPMIVSGMTDQFSDIQSRNIAKLRKRFPEKFTEYDALNRNLEDERTVLEGTPLSEADIESLDLAKVGENEDFHQKSLDMKLASEARMKEAQKDEEDLIKRGVIHSKLGTFLILQLDGDTRRAHAGRLAAREYGKNLFHHEETKQLATEISQTLIAETEKLPPLKKPRP